MSRHAYQMPFSPGGEFVWNRRLSHEGATTEIGQPLDKSKFTPVRLRQMYENRMIVPAPFGEAPPPKYLNNGIGKADQLAREIAAEEAAQDSAKGQGHAKPAQSRPQAKPAAPVRASAAKPAHAVGKKPAKRLRSKPAAKSAPKRATR